MKPLFLFLALSMAGISPESQEATAEPFYTVSYVEVEASSRGAAISRFRTYEAASPGELELEVFEEASRAGHFVLVEKWPTEAAFEAGAEAREALGGAMERIRVSDYDLRPYHELAVNGAPRWGEGVFVVAHVDVSPNPEVPEILRRHAEESRNDPGNLRFDVLQHTMRANHFTVIEGWATMDAYRSHVEAHHTRTYRDALGPFLGSPLDQRLYRVVD